MSLSQAVSLLQQGDAAAARRLLESSSERSAQHDFLLGACAHAQGRIADALKSFTSALQQDPAHAQAACALGSLYAGLGHAQEAEALLRKSLSHVDDAQLRFNLAVVMENAGRHEEALAEYGRLLHWQPQHHAARHNRAGLLARLQRLPEAAQDYRLLLQHHPDQSLPGLNPRHNLGEIELALGNYVTAQELLQTVCHDEPGNGKALLSLAVAQAANADIAASRASFRQLQSVSPIHWEEARARLNNQRGSDSDIDPRLIFLIRQQDHLQACNWQQWSDFGDIFRDFIRSPGHGEMTALAYISMGAPISAQEQRQLMSCIARQIRQAASPREHAVSPASQRLRVAYTAPNFGHHVTGLLFRHFFAAHDPQAVEVHVIGLGKPDDSANLQTIRNTANVTWLDLSALSDEEAAGRIRQLGLDVIVDLAVYNDNPRPEILAARPAPLQVSWQGAAYTTGADFFDYVVCDTMASPGNDWCSEAEVLIPGCYFLFSHDDSPPLVPSRESQGLPPGKFVYSCLNIASKIDPDTFDLWMRLLQQAPDSVLWLLAQSSAQILNLKREAEWRGVDPRRLLFAHRVDPAEHIARQGAADLFLDTRYFNGHTTVAETLWAGTPVLSCPGEKLASRVGASLVKSCQLDELVVSSWQEYEAVALALYRDREKLAGLRQRLAQTRLSAPSFNMRTQAAGLERAYRHMRERFAQGLPPAPFNIADLPG